MDTRGRTTFLTLACALSVLPPAASVIGQEPAGGSRLERCTPPGFAAEVDVRCASITVPEDRTRADGRTIDLKVIVLPATGPEPAPEPLFYLAGGPGGPATFAAPYMGVLFPQLRYGFDLVLIDQRGTGGSGPLQCDYEDLNEMARVTLSLDVSPEMLAECRTNLKADLAHYTTTDAVDDLDEVRAALGYEHINLLAQSYGTRAALVYARRYPGHSRALILQGVAGLSLKVPEHAARDAQSSLEAVLKECQGDVECSQAYPDLPEKLTTLLDRLRGEPAYVEVTDPLRDRPIEFEVTDDIFTGGLRGMLYANPLIQRVPFVIHRAYLGDFRPFAQGAVAYINSLREWYLGAYLAVVCAEDLPHLVESAAALEADGSFLGDHLLRHHARACRDWYGSAVDEGFWEPVQVDVPTLLISGGSDPITPPRVAEVTRQLLPNSLHVVRQGASHSDAAVSSCMDAVMSAFLRAGTVRGLDTSCAATPVPRTFQLPSR